MHSIYENDDKLWKGCSQASNRSIFNTEIKSKNIYLHIKLNISYYLLLFLHEFNHFIRSDFEYCKTPRECEGGKQLFIHVFGHPVINYISIEEANQLLIIRNWNNPNIIRNLISNIESSTTSIKFMNTYTYRCTFE